MPPSLKNTHITLLTSSHDPLYPKDKDWTREKLANWITKAGGHVLQRYTESTTHVVCGEKAWKHRVGDVEAAWAAKQKGHRIFIVGPEWLEMTLLHGKREKESAYAWERLLPYRKRGGAKQKKGDVDIAAEDAVGAVEGKGPQTTRGMLAAAFQEHTESRMTAREKAAMAREVEARREAETKRLGREQEDRRKRREQEAVFRRGARRGQLELLSDNQHIYADATGFKYDITLTKVDPQHNRNERFNLTLQLYETNTLPHTYSMTLHFAGTARHPSHNLICAQGTNFPTALHAFKTVFREKTLVPWDDRLAFAVARSRHERGPPLDCPDGDAGDVGLSGEVRARLRDGLAALADRDGTWERRPFAYHPPRYGPRGVLPAGTTAVFPEVGPRMVQGAARLEAEQRGEVEMWMSGAVAAVGTGGDGREEPGAQTDDFLPAEGYGPKHPRREAETGDDRYAAAADSVSAADGDDLGLGDAGYPFRVGAEDRVSDCDFQATGQNMQDPPQQRYEQAEAATASPSHCPEAQDPDAGADMVDGDPYGQGHARLAQDAAAGLEYMAGVQEAAAATATAAATAGAGPEDIAATNIDERRTRVQGQERERERELDRRCLSCSPDAEEGRATSSWLKRMHAQSEEEEEEEEEEEVMHF